MTLKYRDSAPLSPSGCNVFCLKIILASKGRLIWVSRKTKWITDASISVVLVMKQNADVREDRCWFVVLNVNVLGIDLPGVFQSLRC